MRHFWDIKIFDVKNFRRQKVASDDVGRQNGRQILIQRQKLALGSHFEAFETKKYFFGKFDQNCGYKLDKYRGPNRMSLYSNFS